MNVDSLLKHQFGFEGFMNDPFFNQHFNFNMDPFGNMEKMMRQMDSLRNRPIIPAPSEPQNKQFRQPRQAKPNKPPVKPPHPKPQPADTSNDKIRVI